MHGRKNGLKGLFLYVAVKLLNLVLPVKWLLAVLLIDLKAPRGLNLEATLVPLKLLVAHLLAWKLIHVE